MNKTATKTNPCKCQCKSSDLRKSDKGKWYFDNEKGKRTYCVEYGGFITKQCEKKCTPTRRNNGDAADTSSPKKSPLKAKAPVAKKTTTKTREAIEKEMIKDARALNKLAREQEKLIKEQEKLDKQQLREQEKLIKEQEKLIKEQAKLMKDEKKLEKQQLREMKKKEREATVGAKPPRPPRKKKVPRENIENRLIKEAEALNRKIEWDLRKKQPKRLTKGEMKRQMGIFPNLIKMHKYGELLSPITENQWKEIPSNARNEIKKKQQAKFEEHQKQLGNTFRSFVAEEELKRLINNEIYKNLSPRSRQLVIQKKYTNFRKGEVAAKQNKKAKSLKKQNDKKNNKRSK